MPASHESSMWNKTMKEVVNLKVKVTKRSLTSLLLKKLHRKRTGTPEVEHFVKNIRNNYVKKTMKMKMMTIKIKDSIFQMEKMKKKFDCRMAYLERRWGHNKKKKIS